MTKKMDLRVIKTEENLRNAMLGLLQEKELKAITVKDICNRAICSRNAFYHHYSYKEELYEKIVNESLKHIRGAFRPLIKDITELNDDIYKQYIENILSGFGKSESTLRIILKRDTGIFAKCMIDEIFDELQRSTYLLNIQTNELENRLRNKYVSSALVGFIIEWLSHSEEPVTAAHIYLEKIHLGTIARLSEISRQE